jgi:hypothetical protein
MKRALVLFVALAIFHFSGCASREQVTYVEPELKRITQVDVNTNLPVKSWNARSNTIRQHVTPPIGISFTDAETGQKVQFDGTYKIESYRKPTSTNGSQPPGPESSPMKTPSDGMN